MTIFKYKKKSYFIFLLFLSVFTVFFKRIYEFSTFGLNNFIDVVDICLKIIIYFFFFYIFFIVLDYLKNIKITNKLKLEWNKKDILKGTIIFLVVFLIYLFIFYPGVANWDTVNEIMDFYNGKDPLPFSWIPGQTTISYFLNDHHPIFDTFIFSFFIFIGKLFHNQNFGFFLYCLLQCIATAFSFSLMLCYMSKLRMNENYQKIGFLFLLIFPFISLSAINMVKDSIYAVFFVFYFINYISIVLEDFSMKKGVYLIVLSLLLSLSKKTGLYIVFVSNLGLLLLPNRKKQIKSILLSIFIPFFIISILFKMILFPVLDIYPGGKQETIGFMMQHISTVVVEHDKEIPKNDYKIINSIVSSKDIKNNYSFHSVDGVKNKYNFKASNNDVKQFEMLWLKYLFKYPNCYIKSTVGISGGFFAPVVLISPYFNIPYTSNISYYNLPQLSSIRNLVQNNYTYMTVIPGLNILFYMAVYDFWIPLFTMYSILKNKNYKVLIAMLPIVFSILILLICPLSYYRYIISQIYVIPLIMGISSLKTKSIN